MNEGKLVAPRILAFDGDRKPTSCPPLSKKNWSIATEVNRLGFRAPSDKVEAKVPVPFTNGNIHFFKPITASLGANEDNTYLSARLDGKGLYDPNTRMGRRARRVFEKSLAIQGIGNVSVFHFRVPTFPDTEKKLTSFSREEEVRYWSICLSGEDTSTSGCIKDADAKTLPDANGHFVATVVVGPNHAWLKAEVEKAGYNFLSHSSHRTPILFRWCLVLPLRYPAPAYFFFARPIFVPA